MLDSVHFRTSILVISFSIAVLFLTATNDATIMLPHLILSLLQDQGSGVLVGLLLFYLLWYSLLADILIFKREGSGDLAVIAVPVRDFVIDLILRKQEQTPKSRAGIAYNAYSPVSILGHIGALQLVISYLSIVLGVRPVTLWSAAVVPFGLVFIVGIVLWNPCCLFARSQIGSTAKPYRRVKKNYSFWLASLTCTAAGVAPLILVLFGLARPVEVVAFSTTVSFLLVVALKPGLVPEILNCWFEALVFLTTSLLATILLFSVTGITGIQYYIYRWVMVAGLSSGLASALIAIITISVAYLKGTLTTILLSLFFSVPVLNAVGYSTDWVAVFLAFNLALVHLLSQLRRSSARMPQYWVFGFWFLALANLVWIAQPELVTILPQISRYW